MISMESLESNIHYIKSRENGGYSAGNNIGLRWLVEERCCEYVFIANPDVEFGDDAISAVSEVLHSDPCVAVAATRCFGHDGARVMQWYDLPSLQDAIGFCFAVSRRRAERRRMAAQNDKVAGGGRSTLTPSPALSSGCAQASSSTMGTSMRVHFSMARNASSASRSTSGPQGGRRLRCDIRARSRSWAFLECRHLRENLRSIVLDFEMFRLAGPVGLALPPPLHGPRQRGVQDCLQHTWFSQSGSRRKGTVWWGSTIAVCRNMASSSRIITEVVAYDVLRQRNRDPE